MRQQTKSFIIERKPSRKPNADGQKPSIWGRLDADIAKGLKDEREANDTAVNVCDDKS